MSVELRRKINHEEFDYPMLISALSGYASPRTRITALLRQNIIIRVKKGLYIFGEAYRQRPYSRELLANLIYGPSCISLEYALGYYGLIPERVEALTSVTTNRAKRFETPVGLFTYRPTPTLSVGVAQRGDDGLHFLMAVPERALADRLREHRQSGIRNQRELECFLLEDLRMDGSDLKALDPDLMDQLAIDLKSRKISLCAAVIRKLRRRG